MLTLHLRINDAATLKPTPVRLSITDAAGRFYAPLGRQAEFPVGRGEAVGGQVALGRDLWCVVDGSCEIRLPAGVPLRVRAMKGPEYVPLDEAVTLGAGQMALRFAVKRWSDVRAEGWFPGDSRCHFLTPHEAAVEGAAEDLSVVNLLATVQDVPSQNGTLYPTVANIAAFSGQGAACERGGTLVAVNTLNVHPHLGKVGLLHSHRVVHPLTFGGADETDDWSVGDWCDQCHRKKGLTTWVEPFANTGGEALVAAILGKIDAIEIDTKLKQPALPFYYSLLSAGFVLPLVGGSGKDANTLPLGAVRTYAKLADGEPFTYSNWVAAVRAGRTFVTNGPLLRFNMNEQDVGSRVDGSKGGEYRIRASATSLARFEKLEVILNRRTVVEATVHEADGRWSASIEQSLVADESGWLVARATGATGSMLLPSQRVFAHTSPIVLQVDGQPPKSHPGFVGPLRQQVEQTRVWIEDHGRFADERRKLGLLAHCEEAMRKLDSLTS